MTKAWTRGTKQKVGQKVGVAVKSVSSDPTVVNRVFTYVIKPHIAYRIWLLSDRKEIGIESAKSKET